MSLRVLAPGLWTLVVDRGRSNWRNLGVPLGGAADRTALALGNALVGNPPEASALEITLAGPTLVAGCDLACVLYGAPFQLVRGTNMMWRHVSNVPGLGTLKTCRHNRSGPLSEQHELIAGTTFMLHQGEQLHVGGTPEGMRAYLCVQGGFRVAEILGSRSGLAPLTAGVELPCQPGVIGRRTVHWQRFARWPRGGLPEYLGPWRRLRVLPGPQADWFPSRGFYEPREDEEPALPPRFSIRPASDRMGLRLAGEPLPLPDRELVSEPVCPGSVQVTRDGQCIILGVDGQTIGGYPKIAQVIAADLDLLGQLRPGEQVVFQRVTLEEAEELYRRHEAELCGWLARLRALLPQ
jgi:allophanate hydrolase subunit 2